MKINKKTVDYIAKLAKLSLTDEKSMKIANEFESILTQFQSLDNIDLDDIKIDYFKEDQTSVFREDRPFVFDDKDKLFQNVKSLEGSSIKVPKIIE